MTHEMTPDELREKLKEYPYWYHKIELAPGVITPGFDLDPLWDQVRRVREKVDYKGKNVLDIASFDGMFAFEAEKLGAHKVIASDCLYNSYHNLLFCRDVLRSQILPYYNISPYHLTERLDVLLDEQYDEEEEDRRFDIVQHFGLLYHLRDPMLSLSQARSVLKPGGVLIIETDVLMDTQDSVLLFNGLPNYARVRDNYSVWWAPTKNCLFEMLEATMFEVDRGSYSEFEFLPPAREEGRLTRAQRETVNHDGKTYRIGRGAVVARAIEPGRRNEKFEKELTRTYRNPGLDLRRLRWLERGKGG